MSDEKSWQHVLNQMCEARDVCLARAEKAEAEVERLRALLETIHEAANEARFPPPRSTSAQPK